MRNLLTLIPGVIGLILSGFAQADVARSQLTSAIEAREPTDDLFDTVVGTPGAITTVYFFNHLTNMDGETVVHKWLLNGEEKAVVTLPIASNSWRTYSSKRLNSVLQGNWEVQVWVDDKKLQSHEFTFQIRE